MLIYTIWSQKIRFPNKHSKMPTNQAQTSHSKAQNPKREKKKGFRWWKKEITFEVGNGVGIWDKQGQVGVKAGVYKHNILRGFIRIGTGPRTRFRHEMRHWLVLEVELMRVKVDTQVIVVWRHIHVYICSRRSLEVPQGFCFCFGFLVFQRYIEAQCAHRFKNSTYIF